MDLHSVTCDSLYLTVDYDPPDFVGLKGFIDGVGGGGMLGMIKIVKVLDNNV